MLGTERKPEEVLPQADICQKIVAAVFCADNPLSLLHRESKRVPFSFSYKEAASLRGQMDDPGQREKALSILTWHCLPQLAKALQGVLEMGVEDRELFENGFDATQEAIEGWKPKESPRACDDHLRHRVSLAVQRKLEDQVAEHYGLAARRFPVVLSYFQARRDFTKFYGREATEADFRELESLSEEIGFDRKLRFLTVGLSEKDSCGGDVLARVHCLFSIKSEESLWAMPISDEDILEIISARALKEQMKEETLPALSPRQREVLEFRFGLDDGPEYTLEKIGKFYNLTTGRIHQIEAEALRNLRHPRVSRKIRDFL